MGDYSIRVLTTSISELERRIASIVEAKASQYVKANFMSAGQAIAIEWKDSRFAVGPSQPHHFHASGLWTMLSGLSAPMPLGQGSELNLQFGECSVVIKDSETVGVSLYQFRFEQGSDGKRAGKIFQILCAPDHDEEVASQFQGTLAQIGKLGDVASTAIAAMTSSARESAKALVEVARREAEEIRASAKQINHQKQSDLTEEAKRLSTRREELDKVAVEQRAREESLNKLSARSERRKEAKLLIEEITKLVADGLKATESTKAESGQTWIVAVVLAAISVGLIVWGAAGFSGTDPQDMAGLIFGGTLKLAGVAGLFSTMTFVLKWQAGKHARAQRLEADLRRLVIDLGRANWLMEALMESSEVEDRAIPETLLDRLSKGLFDLESAQAHGGGSSGVTSALSTLLGDHATIRVGPTEVTAEVENRRRFGRRR